MQKFWMVIRQSGVGSDWTRVRHHSHDAARREAFRLARTVGGRFTILEAVEAMDPPQPEYLRSLVSLDEEARLHVEGDNSEDDLIPF